MLQSTSTAWTDANSRLLPIVLVLLAGLQGCAALVAGGAVTGVTVAHDRRTTGTVIEDQAIELKAATALFREEELNSKTHINVTSYNTLVLVTGEAPAEALRRRVIDIVRNIEKVRHVHDEIAIAAPSSLMSRSSDSLITAKVKMRLLTLSDFDGTRVKVVTERGVVYLMGFLSEAEAERVTEVVRGIGGVQKVVKLFEYSAPATAGP